MVPQLLRVVGLPLRGGGVLLLGQIHVEDLERAPPLLQFGEGFADAGALWHRRRSVLRLNAALP